MQAESAKVVLPGASTLSSQRNPEITSVVVINANTASYAK